MASAIIHLKPTLLSKHLIRKKPHKTILLLSSPRQPTNNFSTNSLTLLPVSTKLATRLSFITSAYVSAPASDHNICENAPKLENSSSTETIQSPPSTITWGLVFTLLFKHKLQLAISVATLMGCTASTLTMPILSGQFFEVIIGARPDPLWKLLCKVAVLYTLEPIFTVIFVTNLTNIWEKVMTKLRAIVFKQILIQKVEFFDRYKVGELTGLLTSDLGSIKNVVSENISRDRGFRALSEASYSTLHRCELYVTHSSTCTIVELQHAVSEVSIYYACVHFNFGIDYKNIT